MGVDLKGIFEPRRVAVVGASNLSGDEKRYSMEFTALRERLSNFKGKVDVIDVSGGPQAAKSFSEIKIDSLVIVSLPPQLLDKNIKKIFQRSKYVVLLSKGGEKTALKVASFSKRGTVIGPGSFGVFNSDNGLVAIKSGNLGRGKVGVISDDAMLAKMSVEAAERSLCGISKLICLEKSGVIQMMEFLRKDKETKVVCLVLKNPIGREMIEQIKSVSTEKPVLVFNGGEESKIFISAMKQAGGVLGETLEEIFWGAKTLASGIAMKNKRLAVLTNFESAGVLAKRLIEKNGMIIPKVFPERHGKVVLDGLICLREEAGSNDFRKAIDAIQNEKEIDGLLVICVVGLGALEDEELHRIAERCERFKGKSIGLVLIGARSETLSALSKGMIPVFSDIQSAVAALKIAALRGEVELKMVSR